MMQPVKVPLKIIWVGEHAVCFDKKAIGQVLPHLQLRLEFDGDYRKDNEPAVVAFIDRFWEWCAQDLPNFERSKVPLFKVVADAPFGIGLGTSAALAVALAHLVAKTFVGTGGSQLKNLIERSETNMHFKPSGVDQYLVCQTEGVHTYQVGEGRLMNTAFPYPFVLFDSGGTSTTAEMVTAVKHLWDTKRSKAFNLIRKIGNLSYKMIEDLRKGFYEPIFDIIVENQVLLNELGVVTEPVNDFCIRLKTFKIAAKVTGAGGVDGGSGLILICYQNPDQYNQVRQLADQYNFNLIYKASKSENGYI